MILFLIILYQVIVLCNPSYHVIIRRRLLCWCICRYSEIHARCYLYLTETSPKSYHVVRRYIISRRSACYIEYRWKTAEGSVQRPWPSLFTGTCSSCFGRTRRHACDLLSYRVHSRSLQYNLVEIGVWRRILMKNRRRINSAVLAVIIRGDL